MAKDITPSNSTPKVPAVLSGVQDKFLDGDIHAGVAVGVSASGGLSTLMIPDVTKVKSGISPVFITKPIRIQGDKLTAFLAAKEINLPDQAKRLLSDTTIALEAFYYTNNVETPKKKEDGTVEKDDKGKEIMDAVKKGPILMSFEVKFDKGIISSLTGDDSLKELFDVQSVSLRVLRCEKTDYTILQKYAQELYEE